MDQRCRIVVVGASAGGVSSLETLVAGLPADLNAAVFVVLHIAPYATSNLARILSRCGPLRAVHAQDGEEIRAGQIYVSSPDHHLLVDGERVSVKHGPKENRFRPSIDALFRSAAYAHNERVIGIVLSGLLSDSVSGLWTIKRLGGIAVVQDPDDAALDSMPRNAMAEVDVDHILPATEIGPLVGRLVQGPASRTVQVPQDVTDRIEMEVAVASSENALMRGIMQYGDRTAFTCPECHGALSQITEGSLRRFRCHTGHAFTADALLAGITETAEEALWSATRALEEGVMLLDDTARQLEQAGRSDEAARFLRSSHEMKRRAVALQEQATSQKTIGAGTLREQAGGYRNGGPRRSSTSHLTELP